MICRKAKIGQGRSGNPLAWNTQGQLVSVATNGAFAESYAYDAWGNVQSAMGSWQRGTDISSRRNRATYRDIGTNNRLSLGSLLDGRDRTYKLRFPAGAGYGKVG